MLSNFLVGHKVYLFLTSLLGSVLAQEVQVDTKHIQIETYVFFLI